MGKKGPFHRLLRCNENCVLCAYQWKNPTLNNTALWYGYALLTLCLLGVYLQDSGWLRSTPMVILQDGKLSQEEIIRQLRLHTNIDLSTVERIDIWSYYIPRSQERLARDPCVGYSATIASCVKEFEHTESKRLAHDDLLFMSEYNYTRDRAKGSSGIHGLCDVLQIGKEHRGERTFALAELYRAAETIQYCKKKADTSSGLCEEQIAAARLYSVLHKGYGVGDADRVTLKKLVIQDEHDTKELTFLLHSR